jgi:hypothetical protein
MRRPELACVVAVAPDGSLSGEGAVHRQRDANRKPAYPRDERATVVGLDDCVQVIGLNGEGENPEAPIRCPSDCGQCRIENPDTS